MGGLPGTIHSASGQEAEGQRPVAGAIRQGAFRLCAHWPLVLVLAAYVVSAFVVPTMTDVPINDDWFYARSVERLMREGVLTSGQVTTTLLFQTAWGALFTWLFGLTYGVLRLSTVSLVFLSGWALYGLCRELAIDRARSALGVAVYLFNPLGFVLGFTFMSDPHFTALLIPATLLYVRGIHLGSRGKSQMLLGSAVSACAFLVRHHGILIPLAVVSYLVITGCEPAATACHCWPRSQAFRSSRSAYIICGSGLPMASRAGRVASSGMFSTLVLGTRCCSSGCWPFSR